MLSGKLLAISDLHVGHPDNRRIMEALRPESDEDWLLLPGDVGETVADIESTLALLSQRFAKVVWAPGNHELWTTPKDPVQLRGPERYRHLVDLCRHLGVVTPEDPYPLWDGAGGPLAVAPLFVLYDYSFLTPGRTDKDDALSAAHGSGVVCTDEFFLHPDPYPSRDAWCQSRLAITEARLDAVPDGVRTVLLNHFPLIREPTRVLQYPEFALWCGTTATADWHLRYRSAAVVYGHLHLPRVLWADDVPHYEVSLGYPREWQQRTAAPGPLTEIRPAAPHRMRAV